MPARVEVELDVYSGMPNPTWILTDAEAGSLVRKVAALPRASAAELSGKLGYRGFIVRVTQGADTRLIHIHAGIVHISKGATTDYAGDADRALERWLLETGQSHLESDIVETVERDLR